MSASASSGNHYWNIDRIMYLILGLAIATGLVWLLRTLSDVLLPFFAACFFAYLLQPVVRFNQRWTRLKGRAIPSILTLLEVLFVIGGLTVIFLPTVIDEAGELSAILRDIASGKRPIPEWCAPIVSFVNSHISLEQIYTMLDLSHLSAIVQSGSTVLAESLEVLRGILEWLLMLIYVVFNLIYYPEIVNGFKLIFPRRIRPQAMVIVRDVQNNMDHYFRGQGVVALCAMVFYCTGFSIIQLPLAIPMGILVGILYMIPYFQYVTLIPVTIIAFVYSLGGTEAFLPLIGKSLLVYVITQCICDYLITPHIMGKEMGLNPAVILLSLSVWGSLLGIIGMIIALPLTALLMSYYQRYISEKE
ncbi:MAG: AI-2E family transporter [Duncaniella sp.]|nr:AI-2E family transporter [Duncaniella sp.]